MSEEALLPHPQQAAGCSSSREIKAKKYRIFDFFCLCHRTIRQEFPSPAVHAQPCPDLTPASPPGPTGKVPMGAKPSGAGISWVLGALGAPNPPRMLSLLLCGCREGWEGTPKPLGLVLGVSTGRATTSSARGGRESWEVGAHPGTWPGMAFWCDVLLDFI